jgi:putative transposase
MLKWAAEHNVRLHFIDPEKPMQNGQVESFNGRVRDELLNPNCYPDLSTARAAAAEWLIDYNDLRPHSALGYLSPAEFIKSITNQPTQQLSAA